MKKYLKSLAVMSMLFFSVSGIMAQQPQARKAFSAEEVAEKQVGILKSQLSLTDEQVASIKVLFAERNTKVQELRKNSNGDKEVLKKGGKEIRATTDAGLFKILTPEQKAQYAKIKEERKETRKNRALDKK